MLKYTIEVIGWLAAALMLSAYLLLTMGRVSGRSNVYQWLNVLSGAGFILNSGWNGAYPSAFINVVWVAIGLYGVFGRSRTVLEGQLTERSHN
jgi:formate hydrogenlyase subunit 3/multisubunit Na+/H+ antiporter MnhD subunit